METTVNRYFVEIDKDKFDYTDIGGGVEIKRDYGFHLEAADDTLNLKYYNYFSGTVKNTPRRLSKDFKHDDPIPPETYIYFHHSVQDIENEVGFIGGEHLRWCSHDNIYCKIVDGEIIPTEGTVIVEPIYESEESLYKGDIKIKNKAEIIHERGILRFHSNANPEMKDCVGKTVIFEECCEYDLTVEGKEYFIMDAERILGTLD